MTPVPSKHLPFQERMDPIGSLYFTSDSRQVITGRPCLPPRPAHSPSTIRATSTTPAASASSSTSRAAKSHGVIEKGLQVLLNLLHRGACGCEANTGDGAGVLIQMPDRFLRKATADLGFTLPPAGQYGAGLVFLPKDRTRRLAAAPADRADRRRRRACRPRAGATSRRRLEPRRLGARGEAGHRTGVHRGRQAVGGRRRRGRAGALRARAVRHPQAGRTRRRSPGPRQRQRLLHRQPVGEHADLQGHADGRPDRADLSRPRRPGHGVGARARPPALQHEYVPLVAARPPVPLRRAQRRDQHAARQHQLDARARRAAAVDAARRRSEEDPAGHPRRRQRHGDIRQRARAARHVRPIAAPRDPDDDSGAVVAPRNDDARGQGVLRVPLLRDGAVGRTGVDRLHRRPRHRRGARSQRPASIALLRDEGRPRHHGVRGGRPRHPGRRHPAQRASAPRAAVPRGYGPGADRVGRGGQARARGCAALWRVARGPHRGHRRSAGGAAPAAAQPRADRAAPAAVRLHPGRSRDPARADGRQRGRTDRLDGHRHVAGGAVGSPAAALRLLQAAVRPGHQSAARRHPRRAGDDDGVDGGAGGEPARAAAPSRAGRSRSSTRSSTTIRSRSCATSTNRRSSRRRCRCCTTRARADAGSRQRWIG